MGLSSGLVLSRIEALGWDLGWGLLLAFGFDVLVFQIGVVLAFAFGLGLALGLCLFVCLVLGLVLK